MIIMDILYLISTTEKAKQDMYKLGSHKGSQLKLISRYQTYLIDPIIYFSYPIENPRFIESELKNIFKKYRIKNSNGKLTKWIKMDIHTLIEKLRTF